MFQEEMNKIRASENEADRRRAVCDAKIKEMSADTDARRRISLEEAKKTAARMREEKKADAEKKAAALKEKASLDAKATAEKICADAESRIKSAVALITEGVEKYGSR